MSVLVDLSPLRDSGAFRRLWIGSSVSAVGNQFTAFAAMLAVWRLTGSSLMVGLLGLASAVPLVALAIAGSAFIDSVDRAALARRISLIQATVLAAMAGAAALRSVALLIALTTVTASLGAVGGPARRALTPVVVSPTHLSPAYALSALSFQVSMLVGPTLAALVTAHVSLPACFILDALSFLASAAGLRGLAHQPSDVPRARGFGAVLDGLRFAAQAPAVRGALLSDLAATFLAMPMALFPALNQERFGGSPQTLAWLTTAVAFGGVGASSLSGLVTRRQRPGLVMTICALTWGAALTGAGVVTTLPLTLMLFGIAGAADTWSVTSRTTLIQASTPDSLRGRISSLEQVVGVGGPDLGNFRAGALGNLAGPGTAIALGGLSCILASLTILATIPQVRRHVINT